MISLQQCIAVLRSLVAQLHELDLLRERVRKAELSVRRSRRIGPKKERSISPERPPHSAACFILTTGMRHLASDLF